jgi:hypothetical protein
MSGLKYSRIEIERERRARREAMNKIRILKATIEALKEKIRTILAEIPVGAKESFKEEVQKTQSWLLKDIATPSEELSSSQLNAIATQLQRTNEEGKRLLDSLIEVKEVRRSEKMRALSGQFEKIIVDLKAVESLLNKWRPNEFRNLQEFAQELSAQLEQENFTKVEAGLIQLEDTLERVKKEATELETQDSQRWYVLNALREVCKEIGWKEIEEPHLEDSNDPASRLIYKVDTYFAGTNIFYLTLEGIEVNSAISSKDRLCFKEFDNLSERLKRFGIKTKFERVAADEEPKLIRKGEMDLPDEAVERSFERDEY